MPRLTVVLLTASLFAPNVKAQTPSSDAATLQSLLAEVRQLRLILERVAVAGPRMQLALQRLQIQEQRTARVSAQLDDVRRQISGNASQQPRIAEELRMLDQQISSAVDSNARQQLENRRKELKSAGDRFLAQEQELRTQEGEKNATLQAEQRKLDEINEQLNELERSLAPAKTEKP